MDNLSKGTHIWFQVSDSQQETGVIIKENYEGYYLVECDEKYSKLGTPLIMTVAPNEITTIISGL